jgi:hypothetical protein
MSVDGRSELEVQLVSQLTGIKQEIAKLERQRETLEALLLRTRQEINLRDVTRKNSLDRVLVESSILRSLRRSGKPMATTVLFHTARAMNPHLRNATFRSYLHRLKTKGVIYNTAGRGLWTSVKPEPVEQMPPLAEQI